MNQKDVLEWLESRACKLDGGGRWASKAAEFVRKIGNGAEPADPLQEKPPFDPRSMPRETHSGQPLPPPLEDTPGVRFYILSLKWTKVQDQVLTWWRPDSRGYCSSLDDAGVYTREEARKIEKPGIAVAIEFSLARRFAPRMMTADSLPQPYSYMLHVKHSTEEREKAADQKKFREEHDLPCPECRGLGADHEESCSEYKF